MTAVSAAVVRCHHCNVQSTFMGGEPPGTCDTCGRPLERRPDATVQEVTP